MGTTALAVSLVHTRREGETSADDLVLLLLRYVINAINKIRRLIVSLLIFVKTWEKHPQTTLYYSTPLDEEGEDGIGTTL